MLTLGKEWCKFTIFDNCIIIAHLSHYLRVTSSSLILAAWINIWNSSYACLIWMLFSLNTHFNRDLYMYDPIRWYGCQSQWSVHQLYSQSWIVSICISDIAWSSCLVRYYCWNVFEIDSISPWNILSQIWTGVSWLNYRQNVGYFWPYDP